MAMCEVDGCETKARTLGLCNKHALRLKRLGTVGDTPRARATIDVRLRRRFVVGAPQDCWEWLGAKSKLGYGLIAVGAKGEGQKLAHRVSWEMHNGQTIQEGMAVLHTCDNPPCVNPNHLRVGTQSENNADMRRKDRGSPPPRTQFGTAHHDCKFSEDDVRLIRSAKGGITALAVLFGVSRSTIIRIRSRDTWKHVT